MPGIRCRNCGAVRECGARVGVAVAAVLVGVVADRAGVDDAPWHALSTQPTATRVAAAAQRRDRATCGLGRTTPERATAMCSSMQSAPDRNLTAVALTLRKPSRRDETRAGRT